MQLKRGHAATSPSAMPPTYCLYGGSTLVLFEQMVPFCLTGGCLETNTLASASKRGEQSIRRFAVCPPRSGRSAGLGSFWVLVRAALFREVGAGVSPLGHSTRPVRASHLVFLLCHTNPTSSSSLPSAHLGAQCRLRALALVGDLALPTDTPRKTLWATPLPCPPAKPPAFHLITLANEPLLEPGPNNAHPLQPV